MVPKLSLKSALSNSKFKQSVFLVCIVCAVIVYFLLTRIDLIVHEELYDFGLVFSAQWVDSYRVLVWSIYACLVISVVLSGVVLVSGLLRKKQEIFAKPSLLERTRKAAEKPLPLKLPVKVEEASERPQGLSGEPLPFEDRPRKASEAQMLLKKNQSLPIKNSEVEVQREREPQVVAGSELKSENRFSDMIISCSKCKKTFHRPLVMLDFSGAKPGLVNVCPYCNQVLGCSKAETDVYGDVNVKDEMVKYGNA